MSIRGEYVEYAPATAEDVLAVLQSSDNLRGPGSHGVTFATTVSQWIEAYDVDDVIAEDLGRGLNDFFEIDRTEQEWAEVLRPGHERTVGDVCRFVAETVRLPRVRPARIAGVECRPAGALLALRDLLGDGEIAPSMPVSGYATRHWRLFQQTLVKLLKLSPTPLPPLSVERSLLAPALLGFAAITFVFATIFAMDPDADPIAIALASVSFASLLGGIATAFRPPAEVRFGDLVTFRDLAVRLAEDVR